MTRLRSGTRIAKIKAKGVHTDQNSQIALSGLDRAASGGRLLAIHLRVHSNWGAVGPRCPGRLVSGLEVEPETRVQASEDEDAIQPQARTSIGTNYGE